MGSNKGKPKTIKQTQQPKTGKNIAQGGDPASYYEQYPSWIFHNSDPQCWQFDKEHLGERFWSELFPYMRSIETRRWSEILVSAKKQNHSISVEKLNKAAQKRLSEMCIEAEAVVSLHVTGTHRVYGYMSGSAFNVLWYDEEHGDNDKCVCRSIKKHT